MNYHYKYYKKTEYEEWEYIHFNFLWDRLVDKETGDEYLEENSSGSSTGTFSELSVYHYKQTIPASELAILNREMIKNHGDPPEDAKPSWTTSAINNKVIGNNALLSIYSEKSNIQTQMVQSQLNQFLTGSTPLEVDGKFGGLTERAIRGAQKELGIPQNGIFNTQTLYQIEMATMVKNTPVVMGTQAVQTPAQNLNFWQKGFSVVSGFFSGAERYLSNNLTLGVTEIFDQGAQPWHNDIAYSLGQVSGDILGMIFGAATAVGGIASQGVGLAATPTGVLTAPGITLTAGGTIAAGYGAGVASRSFYNFSNSADNLSDALKNSGSKGGVKTPKINTTTNSKLLPTGEANSITRRVDANGKVISERYYDSNGRAIKDIHYTDHGNPKNHPQVPHEHKWDWSDPKNPKPSK